MSLPKLAILAAVLTGAFAGLGAFTFGYAEGLSYFSTDPRACANCHIMNEQYDSWTQGRRTTPSARCVDCHLPHDFVPQVHRQGRQRLPPLQGLHVPGLPRADP